MQNAILPTFHDLEESHSLKKQVDVAILDFCKTFGTVPHDALLSKIIHYGIDRNILNGLLNFLINKKQCVVVDGTSFCHVDVVFGIRQGTVLGPVVFLLHINDLPSSVSSKVKLFATIYQSG